MSSATCGEVSSLHVGNSEAPSPPFSMSAGTWTGKQITGSCEARASVLSKIHPDLGGPVCAGPGGVLAQALWSEDSELQGAVHAGSHSELQGPECMLAAASCVRNHPEQSKQQAIEFSPQALWNRTGIQDADHSSSIFGRCPNVEPDTRP